MQIFFEGSKAQKQVLESFRFVLENVGEVEDGMSVRDYIECIDKKVNQLLERMNNTTGYTTIHTGETIGVVGSSKSRKIKRTIKAKAKDMKYYRDMQREIAMQMLIKNGLEKCIDFPSPKDVFILDNKGYVCTLDEL